MTNAEMAAQVVANALRDKVEECAKICDEEEKRLDNCGGENYSMARREAAWLASAIRKLNGE